MMHAALSDSDNDLLRAWRRGKLDRGAAEAFETRLFFEPELAEAARVDQAISMGLAEAGPVPQELERTPASRRVAAPWSLLLAASVGALAVLPFALSGDPTPLAGANVEWVSVDARRSSGVEPVLVAPRAGAGLVAIEVPAPAGASGPYSLTVVAQGGGTALRIDGLLPVDGSLSFAFAREALAAGDYRIEIVAAGGAGTPDVLSIRYRPGHQ